MRLLHAASRISVLTAAAMVLAGCFAFAPEKVSRYPSADDEAKGTAVYQPRGDVDEELGLKKSEPAARAEVETARAAAAPAADSAAAPEAAPEKRTEPAAETAGADAPVEAASAPEEPAAAPAPAAVDAKIRISLCDPRASLKLTFPAGSTSSDSSGADWKLVSSKKIDATASLCGNEICLKSELGSKKLPLPARIRPAGGEFLALDGKPHRGELWLRADGKSLRPVLELQVEEYLRGVVPLEIGKLDASGLEAMKAQAVAARTYTVRHAGQNAASGFDLHSDTRDQVYGGVRAEDSLSSRAVSETAGLIVAWKGEPIEAYYHSTCAGRTADASQVWNAAPVPYLASVPDASPEGPWCAASSYMRWERTWTWDELDQLLAKALPAARPDPAVRLSRFERIQILDTLDDGRVKRMEIVGDGSKRVIVKGDRVRWFLANPKQPSSILPSARFRLEPWEDKGIKAIGSGFGHGIGLCQMGARGRSKAGQSFREILQAYYPGTKIEQMKR